MMLLLDATNPETLRLGVHMRGRWTMEETPLQPRASEQIVRLLDRFLAKHTVKTGSVRTLAVAVGPGSYAGIRTTVALANAWAAARGITLQAASDRSLLPRPSKSKARRFLIPAYGRPPHTTKQKQSRSTSRS